MRAKLVALLFLTGLAACENTNEQLTDPNTHHTVQVTSVSVNRDSINLTCGQTFSLGFEVLPKEASQVVNWFSSDTRIVTVSPSGFVTTIGAGNTTVTVTSASNSSKSARTKVVVRPSATCGNPPTDTIPPPPVDTIPPTTPQVTVVLDPANLGFHAGSGCSMQQAYQLKWEVKPVLTTSQAVTFSLTSNGVVNVSSAGLVTIVAVGTTKVIATSVAHPTKKDTVNVTVDNLACPGGTVNLSVNTPAGTTMKVGATQTLSVTTNAADPTVIWSSTRSSVVSVNAQTGAIVALSVSNQADPPQVCAKLRNYPNIPQACVTLTITP